MGLGMQGMMFGLEGYIKKMERPYADQNAQADVEGRPRPASSYGGISRGETGWVNHFPKPPFLSPLIDK